MTGSVSGSCTIIEARGWPQFSPTLPPDLTSRDQPHPGDVTLSSAVFMKISHCKVTTLWILIFSDSLVALSRMLTRYRVSPSEGWAYQLILTRVDIVNGKDWVVRFAPE